MSKKIDYNAPADLLKRLPKASKPTRADMLKLLDSLPNYVGSLLAAGTNRAIFNAIVETIRAQKDSAPANTRAPSNPEQNSEAGSSIPPKALERKIADSVTVAIDPLGSINLYAHGEMLICFTPEQAEQAAQALAELADDLRQDAIARAWSQDLLAATTG